MSNGDQADEVTRRLAAWSKTVAEDIGAAGIYLFGSLVYRGGAQFVPGSDVDLVILFPPAAKDALARTQRLDRLLEHKRRLEVELVDVLKPANAGKPLCSVVVLTQSELAANIHKDGAPGFFSENLFRDLLTGEDRKGIPNAGRRKIDDRLVTEPMRFAQKKRNEFLAVSANGVGGIAPFDGDDPAPKDVMRYAAMAVHKPGKDAVPGAETDTQHGLEFLTVYLNAVRESDPAYRDLQHWLAVRRGARGTVGPLAPKDCMLLAEIVCDAAAKRLAARGDDGANLPSLRGEHSTVWFAQRFAQAFPGVRDIRWFDTQGDVQIRLEKLLEEPLVYSDGQPVWWWRGLNGELPIKRFKSVGDGLYLMDVTELRIRRIAAIHPGPYFCQFIYVEVDAMRPTGLYEHTEEYIAREKSGDAVWGYFWEEYGLVDGVHLVDRAQHDDGAAEIEGRLEDICGRTELRVRYVMPYNFVIAAHGSSINNKDFDRPLMEILNAMLKGEDRLDELQHKLLQLPKRH
jgi:predicted nucleotidyltransferase